MECQRIFDQDTKTVVEQNVSDQNADRWMFIVLRPEGD